MLLKRIVLLLFLLVPILWVAKESFSTSPNFNFDTQSHHLIIRIDPSQHFLKGEDQLIVQFNGKKAQILSFLLHPKLKIIRIVDIKTGKPLHWVETSFSAHAKRLDVSVKKGDSSPFLSISYGGHIYDPVVKERALQFVKGDQTSGLISPEGVFLSSSSHWFPDRPNSMALYNLEISVPAPFRVVTQGELLFEELKDSHWQSRWISGRPTESLTLVAGKYSVKTRKVDGIKISTYFFPEDERYSEVFLNATEEYLKIYSNLLGPYPYKKFDIVQNFFSSGYSFPTFTLLAPEAIRQGKEFLRPGALDHEIVHSWWGHDVGVKAGTGNWVEALTTYCTNYYYKELKMGEGAARKHRQDVMQKYAIQVPPSKDYPLRKFEGKEGEADGQIGYGKGSMVFHMLRQMVGKDLFFVVLMRFHKEYGGKQASWKDIQKVFEEVSGNNLNRFFSQWLDRPGGPQLKLENVGIGVTSKGYMITGEVVQEGDLYQLFLPVEINDGLEKKNILLEVSQKRNSFSIEVPKIPLNLTIDPDHHIFRRLYPEEIIPGLNALLEDPKKIFVISDHEDGESRKIYIELAEMAKEKKGGKILPVHEMSEDKVLNSSLVLLGESWKSPRFSKIISNLPKPIHLENDIFHVNGKKVVEDDESFLITYAHPLRDGKWFTIYFGRSATALSRARYIFFYGWDSYILFKKGRPKERGSFSPLKSFVSYDFLSKDHLDKIQPQRLRKHVSYLASPELTGRFPGTPGYHQTQTYLINQLEEMGIKPIIQPFVITVKDIEKNSLILRTSKTSEGFKAIPFYFSKEGKWKGSALFLADKDHEKSEKIQGKAVISRLEFSDNQDEKILFDEIKNFQIRGASAILFLIKEEDLDRLLPYITYPSYFPPKLEERLRKREEGGYFIPPLIEAAKMVVRAKELDFSISVPIFLVPYSQGEEERIKNLLDLKDVSIEMRLRFKEIQFRDSNIGGMIKGHDPEKREEFLILGAHYDHLGKDEKRGLYYSGADDNASGVSALLEIVRSLMKRRADLRRSLILLFFGGEEWGLWGSRQFVKHPFIPLAQMKAMLSIDTIGGSTNEKEVFFVGESVCPSLAQRSRRFLQRLDIKEGRDIDRYAFAFGSDHYPFHQKGIPSMDFFASEYKKLHSLRDNLESIDFEKLADVTRLIYLTAYEILTEP